MDSAAANDVLNFWFDEPRGVSRETWFRKSDEFDALIRARFSATHDAVSGGRCEFWLAAPDTALAYVIVLDQFSRNMFRDDARAFAADPQALAAARQIVWRRWDQTMLAVERQFVYLPFEHAEDITTQRTSLQLFADIDQLPQTQGLLEWARTHYDIVARFGRFPHRNAALGRLSIAAEREFLLTPGSRF